MTVSHARVTTAARATSAGREGYASFPKRVEEANEEAALQSLHQLCCAVAQTEKQVCVVGSHGQGGWVHDAHALLQQHCLARAATSSHVHQSYDLQVLQSIHAESSHAHACHADQGSTRMTRQK